MKKQKKILRTIGCFAFLFIGFMFLFGVDGQAYIDPSVITYLIQILSGVVISLGAVFGVYGRRIKKFLAKTFGWDEHSHREYESDDIKMW